MTDANVMISVNKYSASCLASKAVTKSPHKNKDYLIYTFNKKKQQTRRTDAGGRGVIESGALVKSVKNIRNT